MPSGHNQPEVRIPFETRFWSKVEKKESGCFEWQGQRNKQGYGRFRHQKRNRLTHRLIWEQTYGPIPDGLCVLHKCDNPPCVNPEHLFLGTNKENTHDMLAKGRGYYGGRKTTVVGTGNPRCILTESQVLELRAIGYDMTQQQLANKFGISRSAARDIRLGINWPHLLGGQS